MFILLKAVFIFVALTSTEAQMTQHKFNKHFVVENSWAPSQRANNVKR